MAHNYTALGDKKKMIDIAQIRKKHEEARKAKEARAKEKANTPQYVSCYGCKSINALSS